MCFEFIPTRSPYDKMCDKVLWVVIEFDLIADQEQSTLSKAKQNDLDYIIQTLVDINFDDADLYRLPWKEAKVFIDTYGNYKKPKNKWKKPSDEFKLITELCDAAKSIRDDIVKQLHDVQSLIIFKQPIQETEAKNIREILMKLQNLRDGTSEVYSLKQY